MAVPFSIQNQTIHLWRVVLTDFSQQEERYVALLSADEIERANRFRFPIHRQRFIIARGVLREVLSLYLNISPAAIIFLYGPRGKPYLQEDSLNLQFNVSHSEDLAVYAITKNTNIGVDIQKVEEKYKDAVAKRFFSASENNALNQLSALERPTAFCRLWACKEALIKAMGEGLYVNLGDFSVTLAAESQWVWVTHDLCREKYYLENFFIQPDYQAAFASQQQIEKKCYFEWSLEGPKVINDLDH